MASVLVVGAGLAGLACAWRLQRAGFDVEVLEREASVGGRARSREHEGYRLESGYAWFSTRDHGLHGLARHVGLASAVQSVLRFPDAIDLGAQWSALRPVDDPFFVRTHALGRGDVLRLGRLRVELLRWRNQLEPMSPAALRVLDDQTASSWLDAHVGDALRRERVVPYASALAGYGAERLSAAAFARAAAGLRVVRPQYLVGGLGQLAEGLAESLPVRRGCEALSIETESEGAHVRYRTASREGRAMADAVVLATGGGEIASLCPKLVPGERGFFESLSFARRTVVHLLLGRAPAIPHRLLAFAPRERFGIAALEVAHHCRGAAPSGAGLLRVLLNESAGERLWASPDAEVTGLVLEDLERSAVGRLQPLEAVVERAPAAAHVAKPGFLSALARFTHRVERSPRIAFAGDFLAGQGAEAAVASGLRSASEIARAVPLQRAR